MFEREFRPSPPRIGDAGVTALVAFAKGARVMTKAAQMRIARQLRRQWGANASIAHQPDGGLIVYLFGADGVRTVLVIDDESSLLLRIIRSGMSALIHINGKPRLAQTSGRACSVGGQALPGPQRS
jgi:hypothetical protein